MLGRRILFLCIQYLVSGDWGLLDVLSDLCCCRWTRLVFLVCVHRLWVLPDCLIKELRKFNSHYVSSPPLEFIQIQPGGVLLQAPEVPGGDEGEPVTWQHQILLLLTSLHVAFLTQKMKFQPSKLHCSCSGGPSIQTIWQSQENGWACRLGVLWHTGGSHAWTKALLISSAGTVPEYKEDFTATVVSVKSVVVNSSWWGRQSLSLPQAGFL